MLHRLQFSRRTLRTIRASTCELGQIKLIGLLCVSFPCESDNTIATNTESWSVLRIEVCEVLPHTQNRQKLHFPLQDQRNYLNGVTWFLRHEHVYSVSKDISLRDPSYTKDYNWCTFLNESTITRLHKKSSGFASEKNGEFVSVNNMKAYWWRRSLAPLILKTDISWVNG